MNSIHWAWTAVLVELGVFLNPLVVGTSLPQFLSTLSLHAMASAIVAYSIFIMLPTRFRQPRAMVLVLLFDFAFITPVVGAFGLLLVIRSTLRSEAQMGRQAQMVSVTLPEYDVQSRDVNRSGQGAIRSRLEVNVPGNVRMQSLLTLQSVPNRVANPILEELLGDSTDDVRLVAFGMLDAGEKKITESIRNERENLLLKSTPEQQFVSLKNLAELHWELIYASLAQGELRQHILEQACKFADAALDLDLPANSGLLFLKGRILLQQGEEIAARAFMEQALAHGQALPSVLPYLAEMAFNERDFARVKEMMAQLAEMNIANKTRAIADLWIGRDNVSNFNDRRFLPHI